MDGHGPFHFDKVLPSWSLVPNVHSHPLRSASLADKIVPARMGMQWVPYAREGRGRTEEGVETHFLLMFDISDNAFCSLHLEWSIVWPMQEGGASV